MTDDTPSDERRAAARSSSKAPRWRRADCSSHVPFFHCLCFPSGPLAALPTALLSGAGDHRAMDTPARSCEQLGSLPLGALLFSEKRGAFIDIAFHVVASDKHLGHLVAQLPSQLPPPNSNSRTQQTYAGPLGSGNEQRRCHPRVGAQGWPKGRVRQEFWLHS